MAVKYSFSVEIEVMASGQTAPYQDSHYQYRITNKNDKKFGYDSIFKFCTEVLHKSYHRDSRPNFASPYMEKFEKTGDNTYEYFVVEPYTD